MRAARGLALAVLAAAGAGCGTLAAGSGTIDVALPSSTPTTTKAFMKTLRECLKAKPFEWREREYDDQAGQLVATKIVPGSQGERRTTASLALRYLPGEKEIVLSVHLDAELNSAPDQLPTLVRLLPQESSHIFEEITKCKDSALSSP